MSLHQEAPVGDVVESRPERILCDLEGQTTMAAALHGVTLGSENKRNLKFIQRRKIT